MDEKENTRELIVVDVKRYKRVKQALEASEERYRQLFENVPIGIYRTTPDGRIMDSNPALVKMLGYESFAELSQRNLKKEYAQPGSKRADFIKRLEREGEIIGLETIWKKKDGSPIHVRENAKLTKTESGEVMFEGTVEDITLSKKAEAAEKIRTQQLEILNCIISSGNVTESMNEMLEKILDCLIKPLAFDMAGIYMHDPETRKVELLALRGAKGKFSLEDKYMSIENLPFSKVLKRGQSVFVDNAREILPDLARKWGWQMAGCVPLLSKGQIVGAISVASCHRSLFSTEEKSILELIGKEAGTLISKLQTETALRESEKYYRTLIDTSPEVIVVMDLDARLLTVNQQFLKTGGYAYDDVIGHSTFDFVAGLDRLFLEKKTTRFIKKKSVSGSEYLFKRKDGQAIPLEVSASLFNDSQGRPKGIIALGRDITERKRNEEAIRKSEESFRRTFEAIPDPAYIWTRQEDGRFILSRFNRAAALVTKGKIKTFLGMEPHLMFAGYPQLLESIDSGMARGGSLDTEFLYKYHSTGESRWLLVDSSKTSADSILVITKDITERKQAELDIAEKNKVLAILNKISLELALLPPASDINEYISKKMMAITNATYVGINRYNRDTRQLEFVNAHTASKLLNELNHVLGKKIGNIKYDVSEAMYKEITSEVVGYRNTLHEVSFGTIPQKTSAVIQRLFAIEKFVGMALVVEGELIGTVIMAIAKGTPAVSMELLKSLSHIVSVSLRRRQAESNLVASEEKFKKLFYISPDAIMLSRLDDSKTVSINKGFSRMLGYKEGEVVGKTTGEINIFKNPDEHYKIVDVMKAKGVAENIECWFASKSGKDISGLVSAAMIEINGEKYIMSTIRDITERKRAERELRESKALLDAVVDNVPHMVFLKEASDLRFVLFNRAGEELLGYDRKRLLGKNNLDLFPAEQAAFFIAKDREVLDGGSDMLDIPEEPIRTASKGQRLLHTRKVCIRGSDGATKYLLGVSEDITERKQAEAKLLAYQEQLQALTSEMILIEERERRRIASELHDQIGQNLALCKLKVAAMEKNPAANEAMKGEMAAVRRLLECSIQDARSLIFDLSPPILYELGLQAALEWLAERIQEQYHVPVEFESRMGELELDNDRQVILFQVVRELLVNVGKHARASQAKVILSHQKPFLKIQVNDDGVGFDASRIFGPREPNGGFGFFSMRERLNYLGGRFEVKSKTGQGSQIILTVPEKGGGAAPEQERP